MMWRRGGWLILTGLVVAGAMIFRPWDGAVLKTRASEQPERTAEVRPTVELVDSTTETIAIDPDLISGMGLEFDTVQSAPPTRPLKMNGQLALDPGRLVHVQSRFGGEVVSERIDPATGHAPQVGDKVHKGQVLAEIWSKEVGEKKSDLVDAISNLFLHESVLEKLRKLQDGAIPLRSIEEMRRTYESDLIAVTRLRRTLRSWRISEDELHEIDIEARRLHEAALNPRDPAKGIPEVADAAREQRWAEIDVISPTEGVILEKNMTVGDTIDSAADLFKIADLSRMRVMVYVFEEDLPRLLGLSPEQRRWRIDWHTNTSDGYSVEPIDSIGHVVDPNQHTAVVTGWIGNPDLVLRVGQFVSATVEIPAERDAVVVPTSAIIDQGERAYVLVAENPEGTRLSRRKVNVLRRTGDSIWLSPSRPRGDQPRAENPVRPVNDSALRPGDRVVVNGAVELHFSLLQKLAQAPADTASSPVGSRPPVQPVPHSASQSAPRSGSQRLVPTEKSAPQERPAPPSN